MASHIHVHVAQYCMHVQCTILYAYFSYSHGDTTNTRHCNQLLPSSVSVQPHKPSGRPGNVVPSLQTPPLYGPRHLHVHTCIYMHDRGLKNVYE